MQAKPCTRDFCHKYVIETSIYAFRYFPYGKSKEAQENQQKRLEIAEKFLFLQTNNQGGLYEKRDG